MMTRQNSPGSSPLAVGLTVTLWIANAVLAVIFSETTLITWVITLAVPVVNVVGLVNLSGRPPIFWRPDITLWALSIAWLLSFILEDAILMVSWFGMALWMIRCYCLSQRKKRARTARDIGV